MTRWERFRDRIKILRQQLSRKRLINFVVSSLMALYIRFVFITCRKTRQIAPEAAPYLSGERQAIFAFWHGRMLMIPPLKPPHRAMHVLSSHHNDAELMVSVLRRFGIGTVRGSSSRGGAKALLGITKKCEEGSSASFTPDGPRGPIYKVRPGVISLSKICQIPIFPVSVSASRHRVLHKSWDKMQMPLPFGTLAVCIGDPILVPADTDEDGIEAYCHTLESALNQSMMDADAMAGIAADNEDKA